jgi:hypothetical protein
LINIVIIVSGVIAIIIGGFPKSVYEEPELGFGLLFFSAMFALISSPVVYAIGNGYGLYYFYKEWKGQGEYRAKELRFICFNALLVFVVMWELLLGFAAVFASQQPGGPEYDNFGILMLIHAATGAHLFLKWPGQFSPLLC